MDVYDQLYDEYEKQFKNSIHTISRISGISKLQVYNDSSHFQSQLITPIVKKKTK